MGDFAKDKSDSASQQQGRGRGYPLMYLPNQTISARPDDPLTFQHLPLRIPDLNV